VRTNLGEKNQFVIPKTLGTKFLMYLECTLSSRIPPRQRAEHFGKQNAWSGRHFSLYIHIIIPSKYSLGMMGKKLNISFLPGTLHWVMPLGSQGVPKIGARRPWFGWPLILGMLCCFQSVTVYFMVNFINYNNGSGKHTSICYDL
jgi:hypothetical protein